jgi:hypothetical protein
MAYLDILILSIVCTVLALLNSKKSDDYFEEKDEYGNLVGKSRKESENIYARVGRENNNEESGEMKDYGGVGNERDRERDIVNIEEN